MKRLIITLAAAVSVFAGSSSDSAKTAEKVTEAQLSAYEKMLAGVLLLNDSYNMTAAKKHHYYTKLLKETGITHEQFSAFVKTQSKSSAEWQKMLERLCSALE